MAIVVGNGHGDTSSNRQLEEKLWIQTCETRLQIDLVSYPKHGDVPGVMVIVVGNGHGDMSSNRQQV